MKTSFVKMDEAGDGTQGAAGSAPAADMSAQQIELLTKSVGLLAEGLQKMEGNQNDIVATLAKITEQSKGEVREQLDNKFGEDVDLEQLSRKDFAAYIVENASKALTAEMQKVLGEVDSKVNNLAANFESKNANEQIQKTAESNPDFWEWSQEMKALLQENPTLTVSRAYHLAKSENQEKANKLKAKYDKPAESKKQSIFGLTPTSSIGSRGDTGKMTQREAAEKAFDKIMGDLGDVINNGDMRLG